MKVLKIIVKLCKKAFKTLLYNREQFTLANAKRAVIGSYREYQLNKVLNNKVGNLELHKQEQFYYRISIMNPTCIANKQCPCTCEVFGRQLIDEPCENNCYPFMMDKETWELYKECNNVNMDLVKEKVLPLVLEYYKNI